MATKPYAVIQTGGKQYRVKRNDVLQVERLHAGVGEDVEISSVLARSDGDRLDLGTPELSDARVTATVVEQVRGSKTVSFKKKRRKGYSRKKGHRQALTVLKVRTIQ